MTEYKSDLEIARLADKQKITNLAKERLSIDSDSLIPYGHYKAKLDSITSNLMKVSQREN